MTKHTPRPGPRRVREKLRTNRRMLLLILALLLIAAGIFLYVYSYVTRGNFGVLDERILVQIPVDELPEDVLYITEERRYYPRGKMTLIIPAVDVYTPVGESTTWDGLMEMPGLYEFSQLPGEGNVNVSIAGHRDIYDMVFYSLDKLAEGDFAYLLYEDLVYQYEYVDARVVDPNEWSVIKPQGFSCLTLTTCDPIGTSLNRLIVRWELVGHQEFDDQYRFVSNNLAQPSQDGSIIRE